jgi:dihydropteroate synthase
MGQLSKTNKFMNINCKGVLIDLSTPKIMGILNLTPNSFFDGGKYKKEQEILNQVAKMLIDGATFIDIGAYSSKPNAEFVSEEEEQKRLIPVINAISKEFPDTLLSIDTFRSQIAREAIENGAAMINDITAGEGDNEMFHIIAKYNVPYIMMHMRGNPQTMQSMTNYEDLLKEILFYFSQKVAKARLLGINDLIIDPGFGFAKTIVQNFELVRKFELLQSLNLPLLAGVSRKSMIYKTLNTDPENALNGTTILNTVLLGKGANILRVHDVKEAAECIALGGRFD